MEHTGNVQENVDGGKVVTVCPFFDENKIAQKNISELEGVCPHCNMAMCVSLTVIYHILCG